MRLPILTSSALASDSFPSAEGSANPLENIRHTLDIQYVTKGGVVYLGDTLDEVWPRQRKYGNYFWVNPDALKADNRPLR